MLSWLSCKKFCESASRNLDQEMPWYQRPGYIFHFLICMTCRRYRKQIIAIDTALKYENKDDQLDGVEALSKDSRNRIEETLKNEL